MLLHLFSKTIRKYYRNCSKATSSEKIFQDVSNLGIYLKENSYTIFQILRAKTVEIEFSV
jgi:hypothetical protein